MEPRRKVEIKPSANYSYRSEGVILDCQYNFDGSLLAIANSIGEVIIYDVLSEGKKRLERYARHKGGVLKLSWSLPEFGNLLASCSIDKTIAIYAEDKKVASLDLPCIPTCIAFCPCDALVLAVGLSNGTIALYLNAGNSWDSGPTTEAHDSSLTALAWSQEFVFNRGKIEWFKRNFKNLNVKDYVPCLASVSTDRRLRVWRLEEGQLVLMAETAAHEKEIRDVSWRPSLFAERKWLVTCGDDGLVKSWELSAKGLGLVHSVAFPSTVWRVAWNHLGTILAVSFSNEEEQIYSKLYTEEGGKLVESAKFKNQ